MSDCRRNHHAVLHSEKEEEVISNTAQSIAKRRVGLGVIKIFTKAGLGKKERINVLIYEGSDTTLIRDNLILSLDCEARKIP